MLWFAHIHLSRRRQVRRRDSSENWKNIMNTESYDQLLSSIEGEILILRAACERSGIHANVYIERLAGLAKKLSAIRVFQRPPPNSVARSQSGEGMQLVLTRLIMLGVGRTGRFVRANRRDRAFWEMDHLHNLPSIARTLNREELAYYLTVCVPCYLRHGPFLKSRERKSFRSYVVRLRRYCEE